MSIFNEILPKLLAISNTTVKNFNDELQAALDCLDKFEEEHQNGRGTAKERAQREKALMTTLQSIHEDDDENNTPDSVKPTTKPAEKPAETKRRVSKKRSKDEVEGMISPEQDKRAKRNASVKAQSIITKQVNVNLTQKMRRDDSVQGEKKSRRRKEDDKENDPLPPIQIKQEKISLPPEPMDTDSLPVDIVVKQEANKDDNAMPPPVAPVPKPRKALQKEKSKEKLKEKEDDSAPSEEESGRRSRRNTKTRKETDTMPPPPAPAPVASSRATRASSRASTRATKQNDPDESAAMPPPEPRPKRTRAKKKLSDSFVYPDGDKSAKQTSVESAPASPTEKPRPKRTRRGKNAEKEIELQKPEPQTIKPKETPQDIPQTPKQERTSLPQSPVLQKPKKDKNDKKTKTRGKKGQDSDDSIQLQNLTSQTEPDATRANETHIQRNMNVTVTMNNTVTAHNDGNMDKTMVLPNGVYNHAPATPASMQVNETMVLQAHETNCRETMILDRNNINDATVIIDKNATVVLDKDPKQVNITDDNDSLLTEDGSEPEVCDPRTPPASAPPASPAQPASAVKEKVQQFEELAARTTRTKTRAMAKMTDDDTHTPPDKIISSKPVLSAETLNKMNNMIFNGKPPTVSSASASKPRAIPVPIKPHQPASTSKLSALNKHKEAAEKEKEDARKKKEAMLEAKRELQKKKREEKMANAAAAREAADKERKLAMEAAAKERMEKQLHADQGKLERLKEVERKKQELARKVAETEERRRAEEAARAQRLAVEQKRAEAARKKQLEEAEAMKKEAEKAKEIEKKQREYLEKQKLKQRLEDKSNTPFKTPGTPGYYPQEPVYMCDGFQYLNSDEEDEPTNRPVPAWSTSKHRKLVLAYQSQVEQVHIDKLFSVRVHSPDLRDIFPNIERTRLKRTSSAVWRTPPRLPPVLEGKW
ncbi:hypothetical protein O0L34_g1837 [Tuta absoluta]|nr:hypothetical protein O0L34_g1837 [Tuta absoluta]